jgi:hypothetical protein
MEVRCGCGGLEVGTFGVQCMARSGGGCGEVGEAVGDVAGGGLDFV